MRMQEEYAAEKAKQNGEVAQRFNVGKLEWRLVHWQSLWSFIRVLMFGAAKYAANNWQKGLNRQQICESLMRHLTAVMDGEENDAESGLPHMGHIMCNAMFHEWFRLNPDKEVVYQDAITNK